MPTNDEVEALCERLLTKADRNYKTGRFFYAPLMQDAATMLRDLMAENERVWEGLRANPWPPSDADLREILATIVGAWWSESTANNNRDPNRRLSVQDIRGVYAVRDALAPYIARATLGEQP